MIQTRIPLRPAAAPDNGRERLRRWWIAALVIAVLAIAGAALLPSFLRPAAAPVAAPPSALPSVSPSPSLSPSPSPSVSATSVSAPQDLLLLPGRVPTRGSGKFAYAPGRGKVLGSKGQLKRFRVAVEQGSNEDVAAFAAQVEATLGDKRSWIGDGQLRLQRVPGNESATFTVYLATRETAGKMCRRGGVNITVAGRPYTSCRATGQAIINLDRWRLSSRPYLTAKIPLAVYRQYVLNHEVGHELGRHHEGCPKRGGPAPVMVQQTLTLRGCVPYAWPRRGNHRFVGPSL
ncbi:DUF3152 domain-containing protein [Actinoplanes friuliensis]|uniref:DUF3152 domain-containing protein n=1 Tax=Actinoplanes friuliensis DSM 7358 TaxID=1246995 RepID=U5VTT7_9ACTN|nr:DUF3152 domain-containing protein [Actinoplanes friuliensis]AGZ39115.1 hypothetical protein AFR_04130 [Actinoplanes friuliensis DSM 7358]